MKSRNAEKRQSSLWDKKKKRWELKERERHKSSRPESNQPKRERHAGKGTGTIRSFLFCFLLPTCLFFHIALSPSSKWPTLFHPRAVVHHTRQAGHHQTLYNTTTTIHTRCIRSQRPLLVFSLSLVSHYINNIELHSDGAHRFIRLHTHTPSSSRYFHVFFSWAFFTTSLLPSLILVLIFFS